MPKSSIYFLKKLYIREGLLMSILTSSVPSLSPCGRVAEPTCWRCGEGVNKEFNKLKCSIKSE